MSESKQGFQGDELDLAGSRKNVDVNDLQDLYDDADLANLDDLDDLDDLALLAPTSEEMEASLCWVFDKMPVLSHRSKLPDILTHLGHAHLIPKY